MYHTDMECELGTVLSVSVHISINVCQCRYTLGESLLYPSSSQQDSHTGIDQTSLGVSEAALSCLAILSDSQQQQQQRQLMMDNILLCGGCSMIPHFGSRFMTELRGYFPSTTPMSKLTCDPAGLCTHCHRTCCCTLNFLKRAEYRITYRSVLQDLQRLLVPQLSQKL